jgi:hypothetical protein
MTIAQPLVQSSLPTRRITSSLRARIKAIVITVLACATAIACVALLRVERTPAQDRYRLYSFDETSNANGKTVKAVYRLDVTTGKTWRIASSPVATGAQDAQHNSIVSWADGWEEMPESTDAAVTKMQAEFQRAASH